MPQLPFNDVFGLNARQPPLPPINSVITTETDPNTGEPVPDLKYNLTQEAPSSYGTLRCACFLWPECPFYAIKHQEYTLTMNSQTVANLPADIRDKLSFLPEGDGVFLKLLENNISTYLSQRKFFVDQRFVCLGIDCPKPQVGNSVISEAITPTRDLTFLPIYEKFHKVLGYSPIDTQETNILPTNLGSIEREDDNDKTALSYFAYNQMWVEIGSLYQNSVRNYEDYGDAIDLLGTNETQNNVTNSLKYNLQNFYSAKWYYKSFVGAPNNLTENLNKIFNTTPKSAYEGATPQPSASVVKPGDILYENIVGTNSEIQQNKQYIYKLPAISGIDGISDPLDLLEEVSRSSVNPFDITSILTANKSVVNGVTSYVVSDINPGLHWGVEKNVPLLTNQGFTLRFVHLSPEPFKVANSTNKYLMRNEFEWLDPFQNNKLNSCVEQSLDNPQRLQAAVESYRSQFNLANQQYILIQFPPDKADESDLSDVFRQTRNLYMLISENMPPVIFRDSGYQVDCDTGFAITDGTPPSEIIWAGGTDPNTDRSFDNAVNDNTQANQTTLKKLTYSSGYYELSKCDFVSSTSLLNATDLRINFRIHSGRLLIQFVGVGVDNRYWIVSNSFEKPESMLATIESRANQNVNLQKKVIPFNFSKNKLRMYGGNRKIAFGYSPLRFESEVNIAFPAQNFQSAPNAPITPQNIHILLSDSTNPYLPAKFLTNFAAQYVDFASKQDPYLYDRKGCIDELPPSAKLAILRSTNIEPLDRPNAMSSYSTKLIINRASQFTQQNGSDEYNHFLNFGITMTSGSLELPLDGQSGTKSWPFAETPTLRSIRLLLPADQAAWKQQNIDLSKYVLSFSDEWSEENFQKITHTGTISFLIPQLRGDQSNEANRIRSVLLGLVDKNFYLRICLWWDRYSQQNANTIYKSTLDTGSSDIFPDPELIGKGQLDYNVMFTGFCSGGTVTVENNKQVMNCTLNDYSKVLQDGLFFNSPYFDRMTDTFAVREILNMVKFRFCPNAPAYLVDRCCADPNVISNIRVDGLTDIKVTKYVLPGSYNQLESPAHKFSDNSPYWEAIEKFALQSSKITYFDSLGRFRYVDMPFDSLLFEQRTSNKSTKAAAYQQVLNEAKKYGLYTASFKDGLLSDTDASYPKHLLIGDYKYERIVVDTKNRILIISTSPNGELFIAGDINYDSFYNPDKEGFIGYEKIYVQMDGIFGSEATVKQMVSHYTKMYIPPLKVSFKARGYRCMTCMMPILFRALGSKKEQPLIISKVSNEIDVQGNRWTQNFDTIWLFEGRDVDFGETREMEVDFRGVVDSPTNVSPPKQN